MAKEIIRKKQKPVKVVQPEKTFGFNIVNLTIVLLYVLTELIPPFGALDVMGSQWLYLSVLNGLVSAYIIITKKFIPGQFFKSALVILYAAFILISGLSFFASYNIIESIVTYTRLLVCFIAFLNLLAIINNDSKILKPLFLLLGLLVLYQSLEVIIRFFINYQKASDIANLILEISGNTGNKNILAASLVIKIPFLIYAVHNIKFFGQLFYLTTLLFSCIAVLILNARSSYLGLFLEMLIYLTLIFLFYFKNRRKINVLMKPALVTGVLIASVFFTQIVFTSIESNKTIRGYGTIMKRIKSTELSEEGTSGRINFWSYAVDYITKHPLTGGGFGNWKLHSIPYEKHLLNDFDISKHAHNDFLEVTADTGIPGGLIYLGIFLYLFSYAAVLLIFDNVSLDSKMVIGALLMSLTAYFVDANFNFPSERPDIQIVFSLFAASIVTCYVAFKRIPEKKEKIKDIYKSVFSLSLIFCCATIYVSYEVYQSMKLQKKTFPDIYGINKQMRHRSEEVNPYFPWIPNISEAGTPIACIKAEYLIREQKFNEALSVLNADKRSNPYLYYAEYLISRIAKNLNQPDSAYHYAKLAFYNRSASVFLFKYLNTMAANKKDSAEVVKSFNEIIKWKTKPELWDVYSQNMMFCTGYHNAESVLSLIRGKLKEFPNDTSLLFRNNFIEGVSCYKQNLFNTAINYYKEALKYKDDVTCRKNMAVAYYKQGLYSEALSILSRLITDQIPDNGDSEYLRGKCYKQLGRLDSACADFMKANALGYSVEAALIDRCR